jgi:hypothetical protein
MTPEPAANGSFVGGVRVQNGSKAAGLAPDGVGTNRPIVVAWVILKMVQMDQNPVIWRS